MPASAVYDVTVRIVNPTKAPPIGVRGGYSYQIAATETTQLLAGTSSLGQLDAASNGAFTRFADRGRLRGAYGPRLVDQLIRVEKQLRADHATRQAVAVLWRPDDDLNVKDVPCTVALTFRVVDNRLDLKVHMRSNDLVLGTPYDWFMFSRLQGAMAEVIGLHPGAYVHHVDNLHVYQRDEARALTYLETGSRLEQEGTLGDASQDATLFTNLGMHRFNSWLQVRTLAKAVLLGSDSAYRRMRWYFDHVTPLEKRQVICPACLYVVDHLELQHDARLLGATACEECRKKGSSR